MNRVLSFNRCGIASLLWFASCTAFAQTCASPIPITDGSGISGTTCGNTNQLPSVANGAILSGDPQTIYDLHDLSALYLDEALTLSASPNSLSLYVCRKPCSTYATCVAVGDTDATGMVQLRLGRPAEYFVVVGSNNGSCASYTLTISGTLND